MANRRTDLRLGSLDIEKIFENANINSQNGKINLGAIASGAQSSVTSVEVGEIQSVNSVRMLVDGILLAQLSGSNPFSGSATTSSFYFNTNLIPGLDEEYDIGSSTLKWRDLYLSGNTIFLGNTKLQTNGSTFNFINSANQTKVVASLDDIPTNATFIQAALADSNFVSSVTGPQGDAGSQGIQGSVGPQGNTGLAGATGADGPQGSTGPQGSQGSQGVAGAPGAQGPEGPTGPQGLQGLQGATGPSGSTGLQGPEGIQGQAGSGITFQGSVALETDLPTDGVQGDAYLVQDDDSLHIHDGSAFVDGGSIQGPQGPQGLQGAQGAAGTQGPSGPQGLQGVAGLAGADGTQGPQGDTGPQGIQGVAGSQGPSGASGAAGASVTTLAISNNTVATALSDGTNISGSVAMDLTSLSDVDITDTAHTLSDGYVLTYDSTHSHWHPESPTEITAGAIAVGDSSVTIADTGTNGNINFTTDGTSRWDVTSAGHMIPATSEDYDIGNASNKVRHLFLSDNSVKLASGDIGADAEGDLTYTKTDETVSKVATQTGNLLTVKGDTTSAAIKLNCEDNSHGVTIQSPAHSEQASYTLTLPNDTGSPNQVLKTDGSGGLGWVDQSGGGGSSRPKMLLYTQNNISPSYYTIAVQDFIDYEGIVFDYDKTNSSATGPSAINVYLPNIATNNLEGYSFIIHNGFDTSNASPMYAVPSSPEKIYRPNYTSLRTTVTVPEQASMTFYATANGYWLTNPKT